MPLADNINSLTKRSLADLDASHDYYINSFAVWRFLHRFILRSSKLSIVRDIGRSLRADDSVIILCWNAASGVEDNDQSRT